jgi:hypothetical protein
MKKLLLLISTIASISAISQSKPQEYFLLDKQGKATTTNGFNFIGGNSNGLYSFKKGMYWGFMDATGKEVLPAIYKNIDRDFKNGSAVVNKTGQTGESEFIDATGKPMFQKKFFIAYNFNEDVAVISEGENKVGVIDKLGNWVVKPTYNYIAEFSNGFARVRLPDRKWGIIDKKGNVVVECKYDDLGSITKEGLAYFKKEGKYGYLNAEGTTVLPNIYEDAYNFNEGLAKVKMNNLWGFINTKAKEIISIKYEKVGHFFSDGLVSVTINNKLGFINKKDKIVIEPKYADYNSAFFEGLSVVCQEVNKVKTFGFINKKGIEVTPCIYSNALNYSNGYSIVSIDK